MLPERTLPEYRASGVRQEVREAEPGHVHGSWSFEEHLASQPSSSLAVYEPFVERLGGFGPFVIPGQPRKRQPLA